MQGIDTNVLVRYILQDDPQQSQQANDFIEGECSPNNPAFINGIILCELVWVLETAYEYERKEISEILDKILRVRQFYIDQPEITWQALRGYSQDGADFADHYIAYLNAKNGCEYTVTFDKKASKLNYFRLLGKTKVAIAA
jgi:predicted nucleic-acid-binding protein